MSAEQSDNSATSKRRVIIQRNPTSGSGRRAQHLRQLIRSLKAADYKVRLFADRDRFDSFVTRPEIRRETACLVAAGGDGTVASLANRHADFPIAVLPLGTENLVARHLKIPASGDFVAKLIQQNRTASFDTGFVNGQRFLVMVSGGVDAEVVRQLSRVRSGNISHLSYVRPILKSFFGYSFPLIHVHDQDGKRVASGSHVIAANMADYGFRMPFCPESQPADGMLDVRVFRAAGTWRTFCHAVRTKFGLADRANDVVRLRLQKLELHSDADAPVQFDGDPVGSCPVQIHLEPDSMTLLVPDGYQQSG